MTIAVPRRTIRCRLAWGLHQSGARWAYEQLASSKLNIVACGHNDRACQTIMKDVSGAATVACVASTEELGGAYMHKKPPPKIGEGC